MRTIRVVAILLLVALPVTGADWPQLLGPARNGHSAEKDLLDVWPAKGLKPIWQRDVGQGYSSPVVAGDKLIIYHRQKDLDVVDCLSPDKGKPHWSASFKTSYEDDFAKGDGPRSTPVIAGGKVYVLSADGELRCLDLKT